MAGSGSSDDDCVQVMSDQQFTENYDWDVDSARGKHESDEQWVLRREFLVRNKERDSKLRVQCLSQVFVNMEFLGCKYPADTMAEVAELSAGILDDYRRAQKEQGRGLSQRTLVTASSVAQKRYNKGGSVVPTKAEDKNMLVRKSDEVACTSSAIKKLKVDEAIVSNGFDSPLSLSPVASEFEEEVKFQSIPAVCSPSCFAGLVLIEFLYLEESPIQLLTKSCEMCHVNYKLETAALHPGTGVGPYVAQFRLGNPDNPSFRGEVISCMKDSAKLQLAIKVIQLLKQHVYTLQIKEVVYSDQEVGRNDLIRNFETEKAPKKIESNSDNVGNKLMKMMGWDGGALGKRGDGIEQPVDISNAVNRTRLGLGHNSRSGFTRKKIQEFLEDELIKHQDLTKEIVFSSDFTKEERNIMHQVARTLNLKSVSYGKDPDRYIVIRQKVNYQQLVEDLIASYHGETQKYRLVKPKLQFTVT